MKSTSEKLHKQAELAMWEVIQEYNHSEVCTVTEFNLLIQNYRKIMEVMSEIRAREYKGL